ncbi:CASP-like protein 4C1 [Diospyros lotus]|uniref:CASP-like protein 4C1 n=1 Tax=Diospyros lotus TaxID=55363 RepID=UPI00225B2379|nr:CASP-like protein 4C1 [Diospyros lotus]
MRSSPAANNGGETPSPRPRIQSHHQPHFQSTVSAQKLRRFNYFILASRAGAFCFSCAAFIFMVINPRGSDSPPRWYQFDAFRYVVAANAIVAAYSLFEMWASLWEISRGITLLPEIVQVWFDFAHDQVFAYLLLSAGSAATELARTLKTADGDTCRASKAFCVQTDIAVALGFAGFLCVGVSSLLSGFRVVCFIINGSRFHL